MVLGLVVFALVFYAGVTLVDRKFQRDGDKWCRENGNLRGVCREGKWIARY